MNIFNFLLWTVVRLFHKHMTVVQNHECLQNCLVLSVAYLGGGPRCDGPPFGPTMKIFYRRLYMKRCAFCHFPARIAKFNNVWWSFVFPNFRKMGKFAVSIEHSEAKSVSASGGLRPPDPPTRGSAPGPRWGLRPQTSVIGSRSTRSPWPPLYQILNMPLSVPICKRFHARQANSARNTTF